MFYVIAFRIKGINDHTDDDDDGGGGGAAAVAGQCKDGLKTSLVMQGCA